MAFLALAGAVASASGVLADNHEDGTLGQDLETKKKGKGHKAGVELLHLYNEYMGYLEDGAEDVFEPSNPFMPLVGDRVVIDSVAQANNGNNLKDDLQKLGLHKGRQKGRSVSGQFPIRSINKLNGVGRLKFARPAYAAIASGLVTSQGDQAMRSDIARAASGVDGAGVTVGTLSDSYNCRGGAADDVASGDLPLGIAVLKEEATCRSGSDEGRAMMQLIHDVAPGASQAFHSAFNGQANFAAGIQDLAATADADVIVDDVIYFLEPLFQDGIIAQAVDAVKSQGVSYFSSAGNNGRDAYQSRFRSSGKPVVFFGADAHDFDPGSGVDRFQRIIVPQGSGFLLVYQWDEPYASVSGAPGSASDMDIFVVNDTSPPSSLRAFSIDGNIGGNPAEFLVFINPSRSGESRFNIVLEKFGGPGPGLMKYVRFDLGPGVVIDEYDTQTGTIYGHANAAGAEAVGAAFYAETPEFGVTPPLLESFSSAGTTPVLFDTAGTRLTAPEERVKPGIVAPDGTNTTFFGRDIPSDSDSFPNFFGTSAAAPHAAAVAALMREKNPALGPEEVLDALRTTAVNMAAPGFDEDTGFGLIQADLAVAAVTPNQPPSAEDDAAETSEDTPVAINVLANDEDADGFLDPTTVAIVSSPDNGLAEIDPSTGEISYTPSQHFNSAAPNGPDSFTYVVQDDQGASSNEATVVVTVNPVNDPPEVSSPPPMNLNEGAAIGIDLDSLVSDLETPVDQILWTGDSSDPEVATVSIEAATRIATISAIDDGPPATITLTATDGGDPHGCTPEDPDCSGPLETQVQFDVSVNPVAPTANAGGPYFGDEGSLIQFGGSGSGPGAEGSTYQWDFDYDGTTFSIDVEGVDLTSPNHAYSDDGPLTAALRLLDSDGDFSVIATAPVEVDNVSPEASLSGPFSGSPGVPVQFEASATDPGEDVLTYHWDFDYDGSNFAPDASGEDLTGPSGIYPSAGVYEAALQVVDDDGGASPLVPATVTIEIPPLHLDIKPGSENNPLNLNGNGVLPAAILSSGAFDAGSIDPGTLLFGVTGSETAPDHGGHLQDVDGDGRLDLMLHFRRAAMGIPEDTPGGSILTLLITGQLFDGNPISGQDQVLIKPKAKSLPVSRPSTPAVSSAAPLANSPTSTLGILVKRALATTLAGGSKQNGASPNPATTVAFPEKGNSDQQGNGTGQTKDKDRGDDPGIGGSDGGNQDDKGDQSRTSAVGGDSGGPATDSQGSGESGQQNDGGSGKGQGDGGNSSENSGGNSGNGNSANSGGGGSAQTETGSSQETGEDATESQNSGDQGGQTAGSENDGAGNQGGDGNAGNGNSNAGDQGNSGGGNSNGNNGDDDGNKGGSDTGNDGAEDGNGSGNGNNGDGNGAGNSNGNGTNEDEDEKGNGGGNGKGNGGGKK